MKVPKVSPYGKKRPLLVGRPELTPTETEVLGYIQNHDWTNKQIAARRGTSKKAVEQIRQKLRQKGYLGTQGTLGRGVTQGTQGVTLGVTTKKRIREEAIQWTADILSAGPKYAKELLTSNKRTLWGVTVLLFPHRLELYFGPEATFKGDTPEECKAQELQFLERLSNRLEYDLSVVLSKDRKANWHRHKWEFATENSDVARNVAAEGEKWRFYAPEDGKLWLTADASRVNKGGGFEHETHHAKTADEDCNKLNKHFDDWGAKVEEHMLDMREGAPVNSELLKISHKIMLLVERMVVRDERTSAHCEETAAGLKATVHLLNVQLSSPQVTQPLSNPDAMPPGWRPPYVG